MFEFRPGPEVIKLFSWSTQLSRVFILLINVKMTTIVGILTFISMINTTFERLKARNFFICRYFSFYEHSVELSMKKVLNPRGQNLYCSHTQSVNVDEDSPRWIHQHGRLKEAFSKYTISTKLSYASPYMYPGPETIKPFHAQIN